MQSARRSARVVLSLDVVLSIVAVFISRDQWLIAAWFNLTAATVCTIWFARHSVGFAILGYYIAIAIEFSMPRTGDIRKSAEDHLTLVVCCVVVGALWGVHAGQTREKSSGIASENSRRL
jgi:hypothetical protein